MATQQVNENLAAITAAGTSIWLDQIKRQLITGGELQRLVDEDSLRGVTSNPAIFNQAILGSDDYDELLEKLAAEGKDNREIYQEIAIRDIQGGCDILRGVYDDSDGADGFVSFEVDPDLAFDSDKTITQAREYWQRVDRPNLMIKIPATTEGIPAIEQMIYEGLNINVTLLFGVEEYAQVAEAYLKGLERRVADGESDLSMASVASFFVSRVDTEVDKRLEGHEHEQELRGKAGLANARAAYMRFKEIFSGERWEQLEAAGARVQRPLWASTGVKDPTYPDTLYVDGLIAPHTVNTMPMATLVAAADHGEVSGPTADEDPAADLKALADAGIDLDDVTTKLLKDGVDKFVDPMEALLTGLGDKRQAVTTSRPSAVHATLPEDLEPKIAARVKAAQDDDVARRIWRKDPTLWGEEGTPELADRLGWLTVTDAMEEQLSDLEAFAAEVRDEGTTDVVLLGMGGSSLAPEVIRQSFGDQSGWPTLHVLDSTDAGAIADVQGAVDLAHTVFLVSTKSGGTIETLSLFEHFWSLKQDGNRFVAITDPGSGLAGLASERGFRRTFLNDPDIGGRYSALSYFGLVPAALMGANVAGLLHRAGIAREVCQSYDKPSDGLWLGIAWGELALAGRDKLTYVVDEPLGSFGLWVEQLIAESTGKQGKGIVPIAGEPLGDADAYGDDRVFLHLRNADAPDEDHDAALEALREAGHPVIVRDTHGADDLGRLFFFAEFAIATAGWVLGINPFDQPNVQEAKDATKQVLDAGDGDQDDAGDAELTALVGQLGAPKYLAIMGYLAPSDDVDAAIEELRVALRDEHGSATTFGYGPRFLHSTGQLHKGGPAEGVFLQLVHDASDDVEIPGQEFAFTRLKHAQAIGDLETLRAHDLPAERVTLSGADAAAAIKELTQRLRGLK